MTSASRKRRASSSSSSPVWSPCSTTPVGLTRTMLGLDATSGQLRLEVRHPVDAGARNVQCKTRAATGHIAGEPDAVAVGDRRPVQVRPAVKTPVAGDWNALAG